MVAAGGDAPLVLLLGPASMAEVGECSRTGLPRSGYDGVPLLLLVRSTPLVRLLELLLTVWPGRIFACFAGT
jgi:hypothetical protein